MGANLFNNYGEAVAMILFVIGCGNLMLQSNLIKKIIGLNIMDTAVYLFLAEKGYISGRVAPIVVDGIQSVEAYINPGAQRTRIDRNRSICVRIRPDAVSDHPTVPKVSYLGSG